MNYVVITSINNLTESIRKFSAIPDWHVIVVGDLKSKRYSHPNVTYLGVEEQMKLNLFSALTTPYNHYSRKNLGYLYAISKGANLIFDTDDDTIPYDDWYPRDFVCDKLVDGSTVINPYTLFTKEKCWPRGLDLSHINKPNTYTISNKGSKIGVWQGVIDDDSDFDAIYRLTINKHIKFNKEDDVAIGTRCYTPFNTQSTLWNTKFHSLLYVPISVDFRFTDILKGYIAQRIMWDYGYQVGFHYPNTYQVRNEHDFYKDFLDEISMYRSIPSLMNTLESIKLQNESIENDLFSVYSALLDIGIVKEEEMINLQHWIDDISKLSKKDLR
jgi:hypothetical protein